MLSGCLAADAEELSVNELVLAYLRQHVGQHYRKNGKPTSEVSCIGAALGFLKDAYGLTAVSEFGPLRLKAVRQKMIEAGMSRRVVNRYVQKVRACFRWGTENELVPPSVFHGLQSAAGLKAGRCEARETDPVKPVPNAFVDAVLTDEERETFRGVVKKLKGSSQKVKRAQILLRADADGPSWTDRKLAEAFSCRTQPVERLRPR